MSDGTGPPQGGPSWKGDPDGPSARVLRLAERAFAARARFDRGDGGPAALAEAIDTVRAALAEPVPDPALRAVLTGWLSSHLYHHWRLTGDRDALAEAESLGRAALRSPHPHPAELHRNQCAALVALFETDTDLAHLDAAAEHGRQAVALSAPGSATRAGCLSNLAAVLHRTHQFRRDPQALDAAIAAEREALATAPPGDPARPRYQHNLATHLRARYDAHRDLDALEEACALAREAAEAFADPLHLVSAAGALLTRCLARGEAADAHEALALEERALALVSPQDPYRAAYLNITSATLGHLAERTGEPDWARRAVAAAAEATAATPAGHMDRPGHLRNLASHRATLFRLTGDTDALRASVEAIQEAADTLPAGHPERGACRSVLTETLVVLYEHTQDPGLPDEAVRAARAALAEGPAEGAQRAPWLNNLSAALRMRYALDRDMTHLTESATAAREAVRLAGDDSRLPQYLGSLGAALRDLGEEGDGETVALRRELVETARRALACTPVEDPRLGRRVGELAWSLVLLSGAGSESSADSMGPAEEAVLVGRRAWEVVPPDRAGHAGVAYTLGTALINLEERPGDRRDLGSTPLLAEAAAVLASGAAATVSLPQDRLECARTLSQLHLSLGRPADALAAVELAADLLPYVAPRHLVRAGRERGLERHPGLPQQIVAAALAAGRPGRAVELLERARGVLLGEIVEARGAPAALPPSLAAEFVRLRDQLAAPPAPPPAAPPGGDGPRVLAEAEERRALADRWQDLLDRIRSTPGLHDFLRPPGLSELLAAAGQGQGPVVLVVDGPDGGHALVVGGTDERPSDDIDAAIRVIPLPRLTTADATHWATRLRQPLRRGDPLDRDDLPAVLEWLWDAVAEPVLTALDPPPGSRLWWCPAGPLVLLPLHAAGRYRQRAAVCVMDRVVSSYTPTLRALAYAREHARRTRRTGGALVVAVPDPGVRQDPAVRQEPTPDASSAPASPPRARPGPLPGAVREAEGVGRRVLGARLLHAAEADRPTVLAALPHHPVAHFACHGVGDALSPAANGLLLADADGLPLTVAAVAGLNLRGMTLAYLSACGTGETRLGLADESVHLASGFQIAGYPHVIGSLWNVPDIASARIADAFYAHAVEHGRLVPDRVPAAFHQAVLEARERYPAHPELWAAYVHHGA